MVQQKLKNGVGLYSLLVSVILLFGTFAPQLPAYLQLARAVQTERLAETNQQKKSISFHTYCRISTSVFEKASLSFTHAITLMALANIIHSRFIENFQTCLAFESSQILLVHAVYFHSGSADLS